MSWHSRLRQRAVVVHTGVQFERARKVEVGADLKLLPRAGQLTQSGGWRLSRIGVQSEPHPVVTAPQLPAIVHGPDSAYVGAVTLTIARIRRNQGKVQIRWRRRGRRHKSYRRRNLSLQTLVRGQVRGPIQRDVFAELDPLACF